MAQNPNAYLPTASAAPSVLSPSGEGVTLAALATYYPTLQQDAVQGTQNQPQAVYPPYPAGQDSEAVGSWYPIAQTNESYATAYGYHLIAAPAPPTEPTGPDPLPPGNDDVAIPGLSESPRELPNCTTDESGRVSEDVTAQSAYYYQQFYQQPTPVALSPTPMTSSVSQVQPAVREGMLGQKELYRRHLQQRDLVAYQQYDTVINAAKSHQQIPGLEITPQTLSAGFSYKSPQMSSAVSHVPFVIKPGIPEKTKTVASTPCYMTVAPPQTLSVPMAAPVKTQETPSTGIPRANERRINGEQQPVQRKRRKFEKGPPLTKLVDREGLEEELKRQERGARFSRPVSQAPTAIQPEDTRHKTKLIGSCQELEKSYFRLSGRPDASVVRPEPVLERALLRLVNLLKTHQVDYFYAADQFKGMRQDCTVQQLQSETCVRIYEASARAHLEYGEIWEYNQCQSNLETLYRLGIPGCRSEFLAYRILYQVLHINKGEAILMNKTIRALASEDRQQPEVSHALALTAALLENDLPQVFRLYVQAPKLERALVDHVLDELRYKAAKLFIKTIRLKEPVELMVEELGFYSQKEVDLEAAVEIPPGCMSAVYEGKAKMVAHRETACQNCIDWLKAHGAVLIDGREGNPMQTRIDPEASRSKLFKAKAENAVAHGDPNLNMSYFLVK